MSVAKDYKIDLLFKW